MLLCVFVIKVHQNSLLCVEIHITVLYLQGQQIGVYGLYVTQAQFEHTGTYECTALTTLHSDTRSAILTVTGNFQYKQYNFDIDNQNI